MRGLLSRTLATARVIRRLRAGQIAARLGIRWKLWRAGRSGLGVMLPRKRRDLAEDWSQRLLRWPVCRHSTSPFSEAAGLRFAADMGWYTTGAGRPMRHRRELSRLELFYHSFLPRMPDGWGFVRRYLEDFPARTSDRVHEWHPYSVSNRLAYWLQFLAVANEPADAQLRYRAAEACRLMTDFVDWVPELDIGANHLLKNRWALALSDALLESDAGRRLESLETYVRELEDQLLPDGAHYELCPMYHAKVMADGRLLLAVLDPSGESVTRLRSLLDRAGRWLEYLRMGDRNWANFNDSWDIPELAESLWADLDQNSWSPEPGLFHLAHSGFIRGNTPAGWRWLLDVGGVGPSFNPGHCHSDVLSLILNWDQHPVVVDPGTLLYSPNDERAFLKSCHAHNGPCLAERDHTEMMSSFRIGRAAHGEGAVTGTDPVQQESEGRHRGYTGCLIERRVSATGGVFRVSDRWSPLAGRTGSPWSRWLWPVALERLRQLEVGGNRIGFRFPSGHPLERLQVRIEAINLDRPRLCVAESFHSLEFGRSQAATESIVTGGRMEAPASLETFIEMI